MKTKRTEQDNKLTNQRQNGKQHTKTHTHTPETDNGQLIAVTATRNIEQKEKERKRETNEKHFNTSSFI